MESLKWKTLSSEYLFKDLWFTVRKDRCETPGGKIVDPYYVYEFPTWVTAFAVTEDNNVLLEIQYRQGIGETHYEIPGGCVDDTDASLEDAIRRELKEETGYEFSDYQYLGKTCANPSTNNNWMHMFLATGGRKVSDQALDDNEEIEIVLTSIEDLRKLIAQNEIKQALHVCTIMYGIAKLESRKPL